MIVPFIKCHGSGNDFVLIDEYAKRLPIEENERVELAKAMSDRRGPIGSDGVLFLQPGDAADARMRMFNPDGTEAELCGNGLRCLARLFYDRTGRETARVETIRAVFGTRVHRPLHPSVATVEIAMSLPSFSPNDVPLARSGELVNEIIPHYHESLRFTALALPNPHLITITPEISEAELVRVGILANEQRDVAVRGANVSFVQPLARDRIYVRTFERGAGLTKSCGSGMVASAITSVRLGVADPGKDLSVYNDGGMVLIRVDGANFAPHLIGNATFDYSATCVWEDGRLGGPIERIDHSDEVESYARFFARTREDLRAAGVATGRAV
jgi:diaminopimelate epimerase